MSNAHLGPVETVESIGRDIEQLSGEMASPIESVSVDEVTELIKWIEQDHPLIGEEVIIDGQELTISFDDGVIKPLVLTMSRNPETTNRTRGIYHGHAVRPAYIPDIDREVDVIVHLLESNRQSYIDSYYNQHDVIEIDHVLAEGSHVSPVLPVHAHSLSKLKGSPIIDRFDSIIYDETMEFEERIQRLGWSANAAFRREAHLGDINYQRVSYLNASGILDQTNIATNNFLVADRASFVDGSSFPTIYGLNSRATLHNPIFDILPGIERIESGAAVIKDTPELYIATVYGEGQWAAMPVSAVGSI